MKEVDILIVGAGPAGLTTANYLGLCGVRTLVVERNPTTVQEARAVSIDDESLRTMQALGLSAEVYAQISPGYGAHYFSPAQNCFAKVQPTTREYGHPRRSAFRQPVLEATLREALDRFDNVEIWFEHTYRNFSQDADGVTAVITDNATGAATEVRARYLAACDGARSEIRKQLGVELAGSTFEEKWLVLDTEDDTDPYPHSVAYCDHRRPGLTLPGPDRTRRWEFLIHPGENPDAFLEEATIRELIRPYRGDDPINVVRKVVYTFHARIADRWRDGRVFLLGDAAHLTPPYAGQGMNSGQRDAFNFAWKAAAAVAGRVGPQVMDSYQQERRDHAWQLIRMALQIGWVMVPRNWFHTYGQIAFFRLAALIPPLRDYFLQMKFKPKPRFTEGLLIPDGVPERHTLVGRMFPQPEVVDANGEARPLDDVLGNGFALVSLAEDPAAAFADLTQPVWDRLAARRVALTDAAGASGGGDGFAAVAVNDPEPPVVATCARYAGKILLIRPDRYVLGAFAPHEAESFAARVDALTAPVAV